ncbi:zinc knuckle CX2CX4HX4C [Artemisia annua]|uniref:Zinc knuckle CX2CX4HX4C n=1 Tax=Artemisia annua TaxID=35608 RepID=A0A2U1P8D3_ARTAN|nr:zinc knuckle CX2CX4HX4C [Artemisia annua]
MSEQEPKPPNPNESNQPPPVVNPPSSRSDKNLKPKKTTRTMNLKLTNTMKHHDMLNKSSDVNVKKVVTTSSSKMGGESMEGMNYMVNGDSLFEMGMSSKGQGDVAEKDGLSSSVLGKKNIDSSCIEVSLPEIPIPVELNPILNPLPREKTSNVSVTKVDGVSNKGDLGKESWVVGETSGTRDVNMQDKKDARKPLLFSNVVQGANYSGSNKLRMVPCAVNEGYGRASYARVLVEVDAAKGMADNVEVWYKNLNRSMKLSVEYAWQPPLCSHCCVFGHSSKKCGARVVNVDENVAKSGAKMQANVKGNDVQQRDEVWQTVPDKKATRNNTDNMIPQAQYNYPYGGGNARVVKNNEKGKEVIMEEMQNQEKNKGGNSGRSSQVKHISQRNFNTKNRYSVLATEVDDGNENEWQGVKVNIDVACEMGIPFDEEEVLKWPQNLQEYYKMKYDAMKKSDKRDLLLNKIKIIENDILTSNKNIEVNSHKLANEGVAFEMESTGASRE